MNEKPELKVDWCSYDAAKYACTHWHYSKCLPTGKLVKIGVWEDNKYIGVVIFGRGASPYLSRTYGLTQIECIELTRVALSNHINTVTKIVSISIDKIKKSMLGLRLIVSFADPFHSHVGVIYQAGNWIYAGDSDKTKMWHIAGKRLHHRSVGAKYGTTVLEKVRILEPGAEIEIAPGKHKYLMPLDKKMRREILKLKKPYPKKGEVEL